MPTSSNPPALCGAAELAGPSVCLFLLPRATAGVVVSKGCLCQGRRWKCFCPAVGLSAGSRAEPGVPPGICCGSDMFYTC